MLTFFVDRILFPDRRSWLEGLREQCMLLRLMREKDISRLTIFCRLDVIPRATELVGGPPRALYVVEID